VESNPGQEFFGFKWDFVPNKGEPISIPYTSSSSVQPAQASQNPTLSPKPGLAKRLS
jgi:hypothetical protein